MGEAQLKTILYAEDEPDIQAIAQIALVSVGGFEVTICSSGEEALSKSQELVPDLILLDVMMPGMDGPTTMLELRKNAGYEEIPVIFMTAKVQPKEIEEYIKLGAVDVIPKPFDPMTLAEKIKSIWSRAKE